MDWIKLFEEFKRRKERLPEVHNLSGIALVVEDKIDIDEDESWTWDFKVRMKNVKGYSEYCKQFKSNDEFEDFKKSKLSEDKINDILD